MRGTSVTTTGPGPERPHRAGDTGPERPHRAGDTGPEQPHRAGDTGGRGRLGGVAGLAAAVLVVAACEGSGTPVARPPATVPGGTTIPVTAPPPGGGARPDERRPERVSFLVRAETCERFAEAVRPVALEAVGPYGFGTTGYSFGSGSVSRSAAGDSAQESTSGPAQAAGGAPVAGADFSGTNVQEAGVDEPDVVKTDGRLLVTAVDGRLRVLDVTGAPRQVGSVAAPGGGDLLLAGSRVLVFSGGGQDGGIPFTEDLGSTGSTPTRPTTTVTVVDLADPAAPRVARTHTIDGAYVDARLVGGVARVVTRSSPDISFPTPTVEDERSASKAQAANADVVRKAGPASFLPKGASCADAHVPVEASGVSTIAVQSLDPSADAPGPAVTVVADASTVYASAGRLFVATSQFGRGGPVQPAVARRSEPAPGPGRTAIHAFDITDPAKARYAGSGDVPGQLLNQFSLSEDNGVLRVATTLDGTGGGGSGGRGGAPEDDTSSPAVERPDRSESRVTILRPTGEEWVETGAVDGLGRGERIFAVRFIGATGYVVTFRQVDPLYVLDLRDVRAPKVTGELKITGYSAYLHPAGDGRLLGIGQEATDQGRQVGTQLSLFDVGDPARPAKLAGAVLSSASSSAEQDHHAFLFWPATGLAVAPVQSYGGPQPLPAPGGALPATGGTARPFVGAVAFRVGDKAITEAGRITHPGSTPIERSLVVGERLLTLSSVGLATNDLSTMADEGFLVFR